MDISRKMCVGEFAVPLQNITKDFEDLHQMLGGAISEEEPQTLESLTLKASMSTTWLKKPLRLKSGRWWVDNCRHLPLLQEIRDAIEKGKVRKGAGTRLSKKTDIVVAIKVRGKILLVVNTVVFVSVVFFSDQAAETLEWIISELIKDKEALLLLQEGTADAPQRSAKKYVQSAEVLEYCAEAVKENITSHPLCHKAWYIPSALCIRVIKVDRSEKKVRIKGLSSHKILQASLGDPLWGEALRHLETAIKECEKFLEEPSVPQVQGSHESQDTEEPEESDA